MPQRDRNAQLEAESRAAFRRVLPTHWAMRNQHEEDVGIDAEVEVFNTDANTGNTTSSGVLFKAQLRATDEPEVQKALAVRVSTEQLRYFERLSLPVLLARYHAPTESFYARWTHLFLLDDAQLEQQTVTLRLSENDRITEASPEAWLEDMVVVVEPKRLGITSGPWTSEFAVTFRNISSQPVYDVHYDLTASPDTSLHLDRLQLMPQFDVNPLQNWVPMAVHGISDSGRPFQLQKFQRMDPGSEYTFIARYKPADDEASEGSRDVQIRIRGVSAEPSPMLHQP